MNLQISSVKSIYFYALQTRGIPKGEDQNIISHFKPLNHVNRKIIQMKSILKSSTLNEFSIHMRREKISSIRSLKKRKNESPQSKQG